ncbi:MAG: acyltransferase family protein [Clostridia bacterium]|nr:acyltransferase family protein [Clostridia bacterium]
MSSASLDKKTDRIIYFDYLRVFATLALIFAHTAAQNWHTADVTGFAWNVFNVFDSIGRWCVPVFVMISGCIFLSRDIPIKKLYSKNILRMVISFIVWSLVYAVFVEGAAEKLMAAILGHYHMWFILMIIGLYMCLPFIKPIVATDSNTKYFLLLSFIFVFLLPELKNLALDFGQVFFNTLPEGGTLADKFIVAINKIYDNIATINVHTVLGFTGFFVLGYYINKTELSKKQRAGIYILGILGFIFTIIVTAFISIKTQSLNQNYYEVLTVNILFNGIAIFTWFKYRSYPHLKLNRFVKKLSDYSFGVYLVHALVLEQLERFGLNTLSFNPLLAVICIGSLVTVISFAISACLHKIPIVNKWLV